MLFYSLKNIICINQIFFHKVIFNVIIIYIYNKMRQAIIRDMHGH